MAGLFHVFLFALPMAVVAQDEAAAALAADDQCESGVEGNCSLTMLQLRGKKMQEEVSTTVATIMEKGSYSSCENFGCGGHYNKHRSCQCTAGCEEYGNCCSDFEEVCAEQATCENYGCGGNYNSKQLCQCNMECTTYSSCCPDYMASCTSTTPSSSPSPWWQKPPWSRPPSPPPSPPSHGQSGVAGHPSAHKTYPKYRDFTLALVEEFDQPIDLDTDPIWTWSDGGLIEGQVRFVKEAISFPAGKMRIEASKTQYPSQTCSHAEVDDIDTKEMSSGEMRTRHNMFRYGRYEASIRAPMVQPHNSITNGNYISTMFVFRDAKYKHWREIDIEITGDHPDSVTTNVLSADNTDKWKASIAESQGFRVQKNLRSSFHTFAFEWLPDSISWYFDGKLIREYKGGNVPIPDLSGKIMMNLWMFDHRAAFGGPEMRNNMYPMYSEYDWFRFYKWDKEDTYPCAGFNTSCLTKDDKYLSSNNPCDGIPQKGTVYGKFPCHATCSHHSR